MEFREGYTVPRDGVPGADEHVSGKTAHEFLQVLRGRRVLTGALRKELFCDRPGWAPSPGTCLTPSQRHGSSVAEGGRPQRCSRQRRPCRPPLLVAPRERTEDRRAPGRGAVGREREAGCPAGAAPSPASPHPAAPRFCDSPRCPAPSGGWS